jgi:predicted 3-demethylubiquinone-9 3-methyltransferase (glyoxalase superfamily)
MQKIVTNLWFDTEAGEAADFYTSLFQDSRIVNKSYYGEGGRRPAGMVLTATFELNGQLFTAINGGPEFKFTEAISLSVNCEGQEEVDELWDKLTADGGQPGPCGWLKDKYGLSWQICPTILGKLLSDPDPLKAQRVTAAMMGMGKLDIAALERARDGE